MYLPKMHQPHPKSHDPHGADPIVLSIFVDGQQRPIFDDQLGKEVLALTLPERLVLGRQDVARGEPGAFRTISFTDHRKLIITPYQQREVSRRCLEISFDTDGSYLRVGNIGNHEVPLSPSDEGRITHRQVRTFLTDELRQTPIRLMVGSNIAVQLGTQTAEAVSSSFSSAQSNISQSLADVASLLNQSRLDDPQSEASSDLERILSAVSAVLEKAANSPDFFISAAEKVCELGNFESCSYLGLDQMANRWQCEVTWPSDSFDPKDGLKFDSKALEFVWNNRQTWSSHVHRDDEDPQHRVVVTPVISRESVVGALYASKQKDEFGDGLKFDYEVKFVEVIRDCLTVGLERLKVEQEVARQQVCLAQFFPPGIAERILNDQTLLETREENITVLFCDIRGFSSISSILGAKQTLQWLRDVLGKLSESVIQHEGVLLEYVGDELVAMWGAPDKQPNHPDLACQAAIDMVKKLDQLNEAWADRIPKDLLPFGVTIGINTGDCVVGRKGTEYKYMWGPLGPTVNIASRVQGATKQFCPHEDEEEENEEEFCPPDILITEATRKALSTKMATRYLGSIRVVNIRQPIEVHQLAANPSVNWNQLRTHYENAYRQFEHRDFLEALNTLDVIAKLEEFHLDGPTKCLRDRALRLLQNPKLIGPNHPVWLLDHK
ncbi:diguanylate cyclase [bacterium]|nr:diguanylate cyclase [bacterium]